MKHVNEQLPTELRTEKRARIRSRLRRNRAVAGSLSALLAIGVVFITIGSAGAEPSAGDWQKLRNCESGGNYAINTGNGYYGAYQFDVGTWRSVGGTGLPSNASPATQDALAYKLWQERGWSPWTCARIVGLPAGGSGGSARVAAKAVAKPVTIAQAGGIDRPYYNRNTGRLVVTGWAADDNSSAHQSKVALTINGRTTNVATTSLRPAVNRIRGLIGRHGFSYSVPVSAHDYRVCATILPMGGTAAVPLGCSTVVVAPAVAAVNATTQSFGRVIVAGWAYDNRMPSHSVQVVTTINGVRHTATANRSSTTVNQRFSIGGSHTLRVVYGLHTGRNTVCVQALGVTSAAKSLGCKVITVAAPRGAVSSLKVAGRTVKINGYGFDPNAAKVKTNVRIVANNGGHIVNAAQPGHRFTAAVLLKKGANKVCVYAMGTPGVVSKLLTCRTVTT